MRLRFAQLWCRLRLDFYFFILKMDPLRPASACARYKGKAVIKKKCESGKRPYSLVIFDEDDPKTAFLEQPVDGSFNVHSLAEGTALQVVVQAITNPGSIKYRAYAQPRDKQPIFSKGKNFSDKVKLTLDKESAAFLKKYAAKRGLLERRYWRAQAIQSVIQECIVAEVFPDILEL